MAVEGRLGDESISKRLSRHYLLRRSLGGYRYWRGDRGNIRMRVPLESDRLSNRYNDVGHRGNGWLIPFVAIELCYDLTSLVRRDSGFLQLSSGPFHQSSESAGKRMEGRAIFVEYSDNR